MTRQELMKESLHEMIVRRDMAQTVLDLSRNKSVEYYNALDVVQRESFNINEMTAALSRDKEDWEIPEADIIELRRLQGRST